MKIVIDNHISDFDVVKRTWKERLFTLPWKYFNSIKKIHSPKAYKLEDGTVLVSGKTYANILKAGSK